MKQYNVKKRTWEEVEEPEEIDPVQRVGSLTLTYNGDGTYVYDDGMGNITMIDVCEMVDDETRYELNVHEGHVTIDSTDGTSISFSLLEEL